MEGQSIKRSDCIKAEVVGKKQTHCQQKKLRESLEMSVTEKAMRECAVACFMQASGSSEGLFPSCIEMGSQ